MAPPTDNLFTSWIEETIRELQRLSFEFRREAAR
jgi:hypothetical protein